MAGPNTTGLPQTDDYNLGRGIVYFADIDAVTGLPKAFRDMGNAPEFNISIEVETLEHQSSREGLKITDKEVTISQKINIALSLDEINFENMAELFAGQKATHTNVAVAGFAEIDKYIVGVQLGRWYDIRNASGERAYNIDAGDLTLEKDGAPDVLLVEGTDYTLDLEMGRFFLLSTAVNIAAGDDLNSTLAAKAGASSVSEVQALIKTTVSGALKFIGENPADADRKTEYHFHQISLKADGDFSLIGDEFTVMQFTGVAERNLLADSASPTLTIRVVDDPTL